MCSGQVEAMLPPPAMTTPVAEETASRTAQNGSSALNPPPESRARTTAANRSAPAARAAANPMRGRASMPYRAADSCGAALIPVIAVAPRARISSTRASNIASSPICII
jgi:hypothetical protein